MKTYPMSSDQIRAWLAIEGWEPFGSRGAKKDYEHVGYIHRGRELYAYIYIHQAEPVALMWDCAHARWLADSAADYGGKFGVAIPDKFLDLLYHAVDAYEDDEAEA